MKEPPTLKKLYEAYLANPSRSLRSDLLRTDPALVKDFFYDAGAAVFHLLTANLKEPITSERWNALLEEVAMPDTRSSEEPGTLAWWCADGVKKFAPKNGRDLASIFFDGVMAVLLVITDGSLSMPTEDGIKRLASELDAYNKARTLN